MADHQPPDRWVVVDDQSFPGEIEDAATASQATLGEKLAALRSMPLVFPHSTPPEAADRWIADGGRDSRPGQ